MTLKKIEDLSLTELWDTASDLNLRALDVLTAWYSAARTGSELKFELERELVRICEGRFAVQLEAIARAILAGEAP